MTTKNHPDLSLTKPDEYLEFVKDLQLQGVGLESAAATIDRLTLAESLAANRRVTVNLDVEFAVIERAANYLRTTAVFEVFQQEEGSEKKLVSISCSFSAMFRTTKVPTAEMSDRFAKNESKLIFWPYLRHFISDTSYRMAITPILVPLTSEFNKASAATKKAHVGKTSKKKHQQIK